MTKFVCGGLTVRKLNVKDASSFAKIATGEMMTKFLPFLRAKNVTQAEEVIRKNSRYNYSLYGLFVKKVGLVSVFAVSPDIYDGANVHYFTGKEYYGNGYAARGIDLLGQFLKTKYDYFLFSVHVENDASIAVQNKIGALEIDSRCNSYIEFCYSL